MWKTCKRLHDKFSIMYFFFKKEYFCIKDSFHYIGNLNPLTFGGKNQRYEKRVTVCDTVIMLC